MRKELISQAKRDPMRLKAERIQYWRNGIMVTAQMPLETARRLVAEGEAYVITDQAIGDIRELGSLE
ncbi:hypothetical protein [Thermosulfurimonas dismutans]|uniref:Uncharacterized protein n=1 Tax=Thermosulfurimonas dismutans TaxID=999894 RepID=A0A179D2X6_9BACT|nr:hypothetical protein [Thermosulfurimonas dismutans]OAQ20333.1 hypothetical protein TDIS_1528 [Thermosulfurimonas dismutans]